MPNADNRDFRAAIARLGFSQSSFARHMRDLGDPRGFTTILRSVSNWCRGETSVPGEAWVILSLLERHANTGPVDLAR